MKILFPLGMFYPTTVGGPSSTLYWHTCYLKNQSVKTYIVTTDFKLDWKKNNIPLNKWIDSDAGKVIYCKTKIMAFPLRALIKTIRKIFVVDIIHYSSAYYYLTLYTILLSILLNKKVVLSPRGEFFPNAINNRKKRIVIKLYKTFQKKIVFHATSDEEKKVISVLFPSSRIVVQPNFIDIPVRRKRKIKNKDFVFLGIIYQVKKIENLIKAFSLSDNIDINKSKLLIAGKPLVERDFIYQKNLEKLVEKLNLQDKVQFIGEIFGREKEVFLNESYVLVLPSKSENFGNVVVEALSQSTPVIASKGTPWSILEEVNAGWWVENEPAILSNVIDKALSLSDEEYLEMCENSYKLVQLKYNINTSKDNNWIQIYRSLKNENYD